MDIVLGVVGAIVGGYISSLLGYGDVTGVNLYSVVIAMIGAVVVLLVYRAVAAKGLIVRPARWRFASGERQRERLAFETFGAAADRGDRRGHASAAVERRVGERDEAGVGRRGRRGRAQGAGDLALVALGRQRAGGDEGRGGRAADAGEAMDQQRLGAIPGADESQAARRHASSAGRTWPGMRSTMSPTPM